MIHLGGRRAKQPEPPAQADWLDVAGLDELGRDGRLVVDVAGVAVLLVRIGEEAVAAVEDECPHLSRSLSDGRVSGTTIQCPGHGYRWDLRTGRPARCYQGAPRPPLNRLAARVEDGRILVAAQKPEQKPETETDPQPPAVPAMREPAAEEGYGQCATP